MQETHEIPETDPRMTSNAISVYDQGADALDDFPVLKAFQQYVDSEQAKARKRMVSLCVFFGILMFVVITFFVVLLMYSSNKKNELYDRLIECAMQDRAHAAPSSAVVVQPSSDTAIMALTAKMDELQKKLASEQEKAAKAAADAAAKAEKAALDAAMPKPPSAEELEIQRLKALLAAEKEKNAEERKKQREAEIEAYRRRYYPEVYERRSPAKAKAVKKVQRPIVEDEPEKDDVDELLEEIKDLKPLSDFDDQEADELPPKPTSKPKKPRAEPPQNSQKEYSIPVDVKGSSSSWVIPEGD